MGEIKKVVCHSCGNTWQCKVGCGISHAKLESIVGFFREETQEDIKRQTQGQPFPVFTFGYQAVGCDSCHEIVSVPVLELGKDHCMYTGVCPRCLKEIKAEQVQAKLICPICSSHELDISREGRWD